MPRGDSTPIFFLAPQKGNGGGAVKRKNAFSLCNPDTACPLAQRDATLNGPAQRPYSPYQNTGGAFIRPPNPAPRAEL